jgi:hypothetical protein
MDDNQNAGVKETDSNYTTREKFPILDPDADMKEYVEMIKKMRIAKAIKKNAIDENEKKTKDIKTKEYVLVKNEGVAMVIIF